MRGHRTYLHLHKWPERVELRGHRQYIEPKPRGKIMEISRNQLNACNASRKTERTRIADTLEFIAKERGASVERREEPAITGYSGQGIVMHFTCNGVGAMIDVDDLHGGQWALISWFNTDHPARLFSARFQRHCGDKGQTRLHHKATSQPADWYSLAMMLDAGLMLAARGEAFEPETAEASAK